MGKRDGFGSLIPRANDYGRVTVPKTYNSDQAPVLRLRDLRAHVAPKSCDAPLRISLDLDGNAEAVRRLAQLFGLYGQADEWNRMARDHGLPMVPQAPALPAASFSATNEGTGPLPPKPLVVRARLGSMPCKRCGHPFHDGWCPKCEDDSSCMGSEFVEEP